jgi:Domain of unknown function (DUF4160)
MHITISHGVCNVLRKEFPDGTTVGSVVADPDVKEQFGDTENMTARVGGERKSSDDVLRDGDLVIIQNESCEKSGYVLTVGQYCFGFWRGEALGREPEHIHVSPKSGGDNRAKFWLRPTIRKEHDGPYRPHELREIMRIIQENYAFLIAEWNRLRRSL